MKFYLMLGFMLCLGILSKSQDFVPPDPPDEQIPVDGGISLLVAAGAVWGIKKLKEKN